MAEYESDITLIRQLALKCEYTINWSLVDRETLLEATIISVNKHYKPLAECILQSIENKSPAPEES